MKKEQGSARFERLVELLERCSNKRGGCDGCFLLKTCVKSFDDKCEEKPKRKRGKK